MLGIAFWLGAFLSKANLHQTTKVMAQTCSAATAELRSWRAAVTLVADEEEKTVPAAAIVTSVADEDNKTAQTSEVVEVGSTRPPAAATPTHEVVTVDTLLDEFRPTIANTVVGMMHELSITHDFNLSMQRMDIGELDIAGMISGLEHAGVSAVTAATQKRNLSSMLASHEQIRLEVNLQRTCSGSARISNWRQAALRFAASGVFGTSGLSYAEERVRVTSRHPAAVVEAGEPQLGDCFAFQGTCMMTFISNQTTLRYVAIEQVDRWRTPDPRTSPRHFSVFSESGERLGDFEYKLAGPARQIFPVSKAQSSKGFSIEFGQGWRSDYTCLYRIQAYS